MLKKTDFAGIDLAHQCRLAPTTPWEQQLGDALEAILGKDITELGAIVRELNAMRVPARDGSPWTEESFTLTMAQMGA